jgi:hypothetical protein
MEAPASPPGSPRPRALRGVRVALAAAVLLLAAVLIRADKPWHGRIGERLRSGERLSFSQTIHLGLYGAGAADLALLLALLATAGVWMRPLAATPEPEHRTSNVRPPRWLAPALIAACVVGAGFRWPLANGSLWWDEIWNLRRAVLGEREPSASDPARLEFNTAGWDRTFFHYSKPTNHIPFSIASRISLGVWRTLTGAKPWEFSEFWFRLPNLLAAMGAIWAIGRLLSEWGEPRAGVAAAFLLALHPWHIRYGVDGRAFSFLLLLSLLGCLALTRALRAGQWRHWLGFGLVQAGLLWTFPYALYLCATLAAAALCGLFAVWGWSRATGVLAGRMLAGGAAAALVLLPLLGPLVPQIAGWTDVEGNAMVHAGFLRELWAGLALGTPWTMPLEPGAAGLPTLKAMIRALPPIGWFVFGVVPAVALAGLVRAVRGDAVVRWVTLGLLAATPLAVVTAWAASHYFYARYVIYGLGALLLLCALGLEEIAGWIARCAPRLASRPLAALALASFVLLFACMTHPQRLLLLTKPIAPQREVAHYLADLAAQRPILAAGLNLGGDTPSVYYPWITVFESPADLAGLSERARAEGRDLIVFYGYNAFNRADAPEVFPWLDTPDYFAVLQTFQGIESQFYYVLMRHTGRPIHAESPPRRAKR